jgi:hypothetical protein
MEKRRPWQPRMKDEPIFNPFEPWGQWIEQFEDGDPIAIEGEEEAKCSVPADLTGTPPADPGV